MNVVLTAVQDGKSALAVNHLPKAGRGWANA